MRRAALAVAASLLGAAPAAAACLLADGQGLQALTLPTAHISVDQQHAIGTTLGSVRVALPRDLSYTCSGSGNLREVRLLSFAAALPGLTDVHPTNVPGIGIRLSASGGSFAGIDDGARPLPYQLALDAQAQRLTGFALQVDFVKIGMIEGGVLAAGPLVDVAIGGTTVVNVTVPAGAITFTVSDCAVLGVSGAVSMGVGTRGADTREDLALQAGCHGNLSVMLQLDQPYLYGSSRTPVNALDSSGASTHSATLGLSVASPAGITPLGLNVEPDALGGVRTRGGVAAGQNGGSMPPH